MTGSARAADKAAWEWTTAERIARRLDPAASRERLTSARGFMVEVVPAPSRQFAIDGARNPEVLLPWELMDTFLSSNALAAASHVAQAAYEPDLALLGWEEAQFWADMHAIKRDYAQARSALQKLLSVTERHERVIVALNRRICSARADALTAARAKYAAFDQFLYLAVAPRVALRSSLATDAVTLNWIEGGCR